MNFDQAIKELNRIARKELGPTTRMGPKRHRHLWACRDRLKRGTTVVFYCLRCDKTKQIFLAELPKD